MSSTATESDDYDGDYSTSPEDEPSLNGTDIDEMDPIDVEYSSSDGARDRRRYLYGDIMTSDSASNSSASRSSWAARRHLKERPNTGRGRSRKRRNVLPAASAQSWGRKVRFSEQAEAAAVASRTPSSVSLDSSTASPSVISSRPDHTPATESLSSVSPLFAYCLGQSLISASSGDDISNQTQTTFRLLTKVDKALLLDPTSGFLHKIRYESSLREVKDRHKGWLRLNADQPRKREDKLGEDENEDGAIEMDPDAATKIMEERLDHTDGADQPLPNTGDGTREDPGLTPPGRQRQQQQQHATRQKATTAANDDSVRNTEMITRSIFVVSKKIMALFISLEIELVHPVLRRYWGSLDRICRASFLYTQVIQKKKKSEIV